MFLLLTRLILDVASNVIGQAILDHWGSLGLLAVIAWLVFHFREWFWGIYSQISIHFRYGRNQARRERNRKSRFSGQPEYFLQDANPKRKTRREVLGWVSALATFTAGGVWLTRVLRPGWTISGQFVQSEKKRGGIQVGCLREDSTGGRFPVASMETDDSGYFKFTGLFPGRYLLLGYALDEAKKLASWTHLIREIEDKDIQLGDNDLDSHVGSYHEFPRIHFKTDSFELDSEADQILAGIKLALKDCPGLVIIEGRTTAAAGDFGNYDNFGLSCRRCSAVEEELRKALSDRDVVSVPLEAKSPLKGPAIRSNDSAQRSVRILVLQS